MSGDAPPPPEAGRPGRRFDSRHLLYGVAVGLVSVPAFLYLGAALGGLALAGLFIPLIVGIVLLTRDTPIRRGWGLGLLIGWGVGIPVTAGVCVAVFRSFGY